LIFAAVNIIPINDTRPSWKLFGYRIFGLFQAFSMNLMITNIIKFTYGELRPDFLDRCQPNTNLTCTGSESVVKEGRLSFPSGHASISANGLIYLALFLFYELGLGSRSLRTDSEQGGSSMVFLKLSVVIAPLIGVALVCVSRVVDHRHFPHDVVWGALLGGAIAVGVFYIHFYPPYGQAHYITATRKRVRTSSDDGKEEIEINVKSVTLESV